MPLSRQALRLDPDPRSVSAARRWVASLCEELHRDELIACAELGVSELVTNALIHADAPITVGVRGTAESIRVEVSDGSRTIPVVAEEDLVDPWATFGRGLAIVARCSRAWGAALEPAGKTVWFEPVAEPVEEGPPAPAVLDLSTPSAPPVPRTSAFRVRLARVPVHELLSVRHHYQTLRRELRLLALVHADDYPLAQELTDVAGRVDQQFPDDAVRRADEALRAQQPTFDLDTYAAHAAPPLLERLLELLDQADEFCRTHQLLSLARTPLQREFQRWYLTEFVRQAGGEPPLPWASELAAASDTTGT